MEQCFFYTLEVSGNENSFPKVGSQCSPNLFYFCSAEERKSYSLGNVNDDRIFIHLTDFRLRLLTWLILFDRCSGSGGHTAEEKEHYKRELQEQITEKQSHRRRCVFMHNILTGVFGSISVKRLIAINHIQK